MVTLTADVVVAGAGVIGSSTALELTRAGFQVVVCSIGPASPTRYGTRPCWRSGCRDSTWGGSGHPRGSTTTRSGQIPRSSSAPCGLRMQAGWTIRCWLRSTSLTPPAMQVRGSCTRVRSPPYDEPAAGLPASAWRTANGWTHPSWSMWRDRGRRRSTRWQASVTTSPSRPVRCVKRCTS
ncbi:FAD-dependent oxidoreductase [Nonomuraea diastatica]|uniref:FAD-dependent oxidoreductase n=1 Tax=Nonomuraea diastatica TaxID=1848329 RepID=A0A4R4WHP3_9ACTN|nr:FAD-dependent oxidoreductase [Nonomuraea diastatica]